MPGTGEAGASGGTFVLRDATSQDLAQASALMVEAYAPYFENVGPGEQGFVEMYLGNVADVRSRLDIAELVVAEEVAPGGAAGWLLGAVTFFPDSAGAGEGWPEGWAAIRLLAVSPGARGRGIGRALTEECLRRARANGTPTVALHTADVMSVAKAMYERMGFTRVPEYDFSPDGATKVYAYKLDL